MTSCSKSIASTASVARAIQGGQKVQRFLGIGQCFDSPLVRSGTLNASSYLTHWSCSKGNTSPYSKERWRLQQQKKDVRQLQECVNRCCPGRGSAEVSNTYVMVRNFEMRIYLYIYAFFIHFPKVCFTKTCEIALLQMYKKTWEGEKRKKKTTCKNSGWTYAAITCTVTSSSWGS